MRFFSYTEISAL